MTESAYLPSHRRGQPCAPRAISRAKYQPIYDGLEEEQSLFQLVGDIKLQFVGNIKNVCLTSGLNHVLFAKEALLWLNTF